MDQANIIASIVKECLQGPDFSKLKKEILTHEFVSVYWEVIKGIRTEKRKNYTNTKKILFVTDRSVIVQDVELQCGSSRFVTYQIYLKDWEKVFALDFLREEVGYASLLGGRNLYVPESLNYVHCLLYCQLKNNHIVHFTRR